MLGKVIGGAAGVVVLLHFGGRWVAEEVMDVINVVRRKWREGSQES